VQRGPQRLRALSWRAGAARRVDLLPEAGQAANAGARGTPPTGRPMGRRADIEGLRGLAVGLVLLHHLLPAVFPGGYVGVDVFFVISGLLVVGRLEARRAAGALSLPVFYAGRALRLLPSLAVVVGATAAAGSLLYASPARAQLGAAVAWAALSAGNLHLYASADYFAAPPELWPLLHLWSLGVEEQFYLLAPLGLLAAGGRPGALRAGLIALCAASFVGSVVAVQVDRPAAFALLPFRAWEIGLGALLPFAAALGGRARAAAGLLGLGMMGAAAALYTPATAFPGAAALLPAGGAALSLAAGESSPAGRLLSARPLRALGQISYPLYLWHWPVVAFAHFWTMRGPTPLEALGIGVLCVGLATATHHLVELPPQRWGARARPEQLTAALRSAALLSGAVALAGASAWGRHRPPDRPDRPEREAAELWARPDAGCDHLARGGEDQRGCAAGPTSGPLDLLVWGDSHAGAAAPPLVAAAAARGWRARAMVKNACPPLPGVEPEGSASSVSCAEHNDALMKLFAQEPPRVVVLAARWTRYDDTPAPTDDGPARRLLRAGSVGHALPLQAALRRTLAALAQVGARVVIVGPAPEPGFHVPVALERAARLGLPVPEPPTRAAWAARSAAVRAALEAGADGRAAQVDPAPLLCGDAICPPVNAQGEPFFVDDNHLAPAGAARLFDGVWPEVEAARAAACAAGAGC